MRTKIPLLALGVVAAFALPGCGGLFFSSAGEDNTPPPPDPDTYVLQGLATFSNASNYTYDTTDLTATVGAMTLTASHRVFSFGPADRRMSVAIPNLAYPIHGSVFPVRAANGADTASLGGIIGLQLTTPTVYEGNQGSVTLKQTATGPQLVYNGTLAHVDGMTSGGVDTLVTLDLPGYTILPGTPSGAWGAVYEDQPAGAPQIHKQIFRNYTNASGGTVQMEVEFADGDRLVLFIPSSSNGTFIVGNGTDPSTASAMYSDFETNTGYGSTTAGKLYLVVDSTGYYITFEGIRFGPNAPPTSALSGAVRQETGGDL